MCNICCSRCWANLVEGAQYVYLVTLRHSEPRLEVSSFSFLRMSLGSLLSIFFFFKIFKFFYFFIFLFFLMLFLSAYILFMYVCMYVCMAVLGPRFRARALSSCGKRGPLFTAVRGPLTIAASRCRAQAPDAQAQQPWLTGQAAPRHVGSSQTRARTRVPCTGRQTLNHCATREAPFPFLQVILL